MTMTEATVLLIALILPWLMGVGLMRLLLRSPEISRCTTWGYGYVAGFMLLTLILRGYAGWADQHHFWSIAVLLAGVTALLMLLGWRPSGRPREAPHGLADAWPREAWQRVAFVVLLAVLLARLLDLTLEVVWQPLYAWDAWAAWAPKARVWLEHRALVPFVDMEAWVEAGDGLRYTGVAWDYPPAVPLIQYWMALSLGEWDDSLVNLPWVLLPAALGLALYGQALTWRISPLLALIGVYCLLSLPLLNAHTGLPGYADLWLAAGYGMASMALFQWLRTRDRDQLLLAALMAAACPLIKHEGWVWALSLVPITAWGLMSPPVRAATKVGLAVGVVVIAAAIALDHYGYWDWYVDKHGILPETLVLPVVGSVQLAYSPVWAAVGKNLLWLDSWHLLWLALAAALVYGLTDRGVRQLSYLAPMGAQAALALSIVFAIFFLTENAAWARDYTSLNRVLLQVVPMLVFFGLAVLQARLEHSQALG